MKGTVMKNPIFKRALSALLALGMIASSASYVLAVDDTEANKETLGITENGGENMIQSTNKDDDLIKLANGLVNGTYTAYTSPDRGILNIKNQTMSLDYTLWAGSGNMQVNSLTNTKGVSYIEDTMDVFVKTEDGEIYYASKSTSSATMNIYRYGYYYYENRIEGQIFVPEIEAVNSQAINHLKPSSSNHVKNASTSGGEYSFTVSGGDPYVTFSGLSIDTTAYDYVAITVKAAEAAASSQLFIIAGSGSTYTEGQSYTFAMASDGEYHTYYVPLSLINDYTGTLSALRFDINGAIGSKVYIRSINLIKSQDMKLDTSLSIQRSFLTYSDKLHHLTQFSTSKDIDGIECVGMQTKIKADTVEAFVIKDASGLHYDTLSGIDWATAEYAGFVIKNAGVFGYILPADGQSGNIEITVEGNYAVITQTLPVSAFTPSAAGSRNANDIFFGQRIYNDESQDFTAFLKEAECERNPLTSENITVDFNDEGAAFVGYDALRGYYQFAINGTNFNGAYYDHPNRHFNVRFTVTGDEYDRQMYFMSRCSKSGCVETAVLLNDQDMLLPIPMEVAKNFTGDGENTIYNLDDAQYGETYFPVIAKSGESRTYNLVNLYQTWGQFPLKQISSIQFHQPYYHLSTGVTETNCIVPYPVNGPGLPDHRTMSAPFWTGQPQHNSGGGHSFLNYTDADGKGATSQNTNATIGSYGPTYCDITLGSISSDGRVQAEYTHIEMPQTDENRAYYEMKYTFLEDVSFSKFYESFIFYSVTDNSNTGVYQKVGYLDINNEYQVVDAEHSSNAKSYVLGKESPYFSFFMMPDWERDSPHVQGYANLAMLFKDWKVVMNGEETVPNLRITNKNERIYLSMDMDDVTFKAGDTITINAILMPWGSQQMEDDPANRLYNAQTANYNSPHYSDELPDGTLYMDKNVRDVRENTLLNPLTVTALDGATVIENAFLPKVQSTNGKSATFTLSGGTNNNAVRVYGFDKLTVPKIEELVNGEWVEYSVSSKTTPDQMGYRHSYDGYMVHYDEDGSYSYSFVYDMTGYESRTFRISADEDFEGWVFDPDAVMQTPIDVIVTGKELYSSSSKAKADFYSTKELLEDGSGVRLYINPSAGESYSVAYEGGTKLTGKYIVFKYRIPSTNSKLSNLEFWTSTQRTGAGGNDNIKIESCAVRNDGEWHVMVIDVAQLKSANCTFEQNEYGAFVPRYLRVDTTNTKMSDGDYVDFAYIGFSNSIAEIVAANGDVDTVDIINSDKKTYTSISTADYAPSEDGAVKIELDSLLFNADHDTFTLNVNVKNNSGFNFLRLTPQFDFDRFELVSIENGDLCSDFTQLNGSLILSAQDTVTEDGTLAKLTFKVKGGSLDAGDYAFGVNVLDAFSTATTEVTTLLSDGTLTALAVLYGDCDNDGKITLQDVAVLREYLADGEAEAPSLIFNFTADANDDGVIDTCDLVLIRKYLADYDFDNDQPGLTLGKQN